MNTGVFSHINWLATLVGAVGYFILGAIWYSALFRNAWIKASGVNVNDPNAKKGVAGMMIASFISIVITTVGIALFISRVGGPGGWITGLKVGLVAGVCFSAATIWNSYLYEKRPMALSLINGFYNIFGSVIAGIIISVWK